MSLDIYLHSPSLHECTCNNCGAVHTSKEPATVYSANITHNLSKMANEAGIKRLPAKAGRFGIN